MFADVFDNRRLGIMEQLFSVLVILLFCIKGIERLGLNHDGVPRKGEAQGLVSAADVALDTSR